MGDGWRAPTVPRNMLNIWAVVNPRPVRAAYMFTSRTNAPHRCRSRSPLSRCNSSSGHAKRTTGNWLLLVPGKPQPASQHVPPVAMGRTHANRYQRREMLCQSPCFYSYPQRAERTLTADEVNAAHAKLKQRLTAELGVALRE